MNIWRTFLSELNERQQLKWSESFLDGSFVPAKKGAAESEKPSGARGRSGWWWSTAAVFLWETTCTLHPRGSQARGNDARGDPDKTTSSGGPSTTETSAGDRRQSVRQRSVAKAVATSRDRIDLSAQEKSHSTRDAGWPSLASLQKAMDCRTDQRLARKLPTLGRALRPFAHDLWRFFSYRLLHDRLTEGCAIASRNSSSAWSKT